MPVGTVDKLLKWIETGHKSAPLTDNELLDLVNCVEFSRRMGRLIEGVLTDTQLDFKPIQGPTIRQFWEPVKSAYAKVEPDLDITKG